LPVLASLGLALGPCAVGADAEDPQYTVTDIGALDPAYVQTEPKAISERGDVVGYSMAPVPSGGWNSRAFVYRDGVMTELGTLGGPFSGAYGINDAGEIVGYASRPGATFRAFRHDGTTMIDLDPLGGPQAFANDIYDAGQIVGWANPPTSGYNHAFYYDGAGAVDIHLQFPSALQSVANGLNDAGDVVGFLISGSRYEAFLYRDGQATILPSLGGSLTQATDINDVGQATGFSSTTSNASHAVMWASDGSIRDLGTLGGYYSWAFDINDSGHVVGESSTNDGRPGPFVHDGQGMRNLNDLIPADSGWTLYRATGINDAGQIVGYGLREGLGGLHGFLLTPMTPADRIARLVGTVQGMGLPQGLETSFVQKLENALASLEAGDVPTACDQMQAFINHARAQSGKGELSEEEASLMITQAEGIRSALGCS
jgi:probable HAF family extracellular repeat protein